MARRMFTETVTRSDAFLDMPSSTQALYFHLLSEADDDGFVSSPKMVMRIVGANTDEIRMLVSKKFLIPFEGGVCVIKHWRMHNQVRKDRYVETKYKKEKASLYIRSNGAYTTNPNDAIPVPNGYFAVENIDNLLLATTGCQLDALGKGRVGKVNNSEQSSQRPLRNKKKDMAWKKYNENQHSEDVPAIDIDSGEKLPDDKDLEREQNKKVTTLIEWAEKMRGKVFMDIPTQRKMVHTLRIKGISPTVIQQTYLDLLQSDYWKQQDRLPDFKSVVSTLKNKK